MCVYLYIHTLINTNPHIYKIYIFIICVSYNLYKQQQTDWWTYTKGTAEIQSFFQSPSSGS